MGNYDSPAEEMQTVYAVIKVKSDCGSLELLFQVIR